MGCPPHQITFGTDDQVKNFRFSGRLYQSLPKIVFDFIVSRLSKNVKLLPRRSMTFVCNKGTQGGGPRKRTEFLTHFFILFKHTIEQ